MPKISVIMSVYKEPLEWIKESIDSILGQTFHDFEFIIVDDNPEDEDLLAFLMEYEDKDGRIHILQNEKNEGLPFCLNKAINHSKGIYIARMDADDIAFPRRLQVQYDYLNHHSEVQVCGTWARRFGDMPKLSYKGFKFPVSFEQTLIFSIFASPLIHPSVMARTEIIKKYMYNDQLRKAQDYDLWCRMLCDDLILVSLPQNLIRYRVTAKSLAKSSLSKQEDVAKQARVCLLKHQGLDATRQEKVLHNEICNASVVEMKAAELWLKKLKKNLIQKFPQQIPYITRLIGEKWAAICVIGGVSYKQYWQSELYPGFSWLVVLRFAKGIFSRLVN